MLSKRTVHTALGLTAAALLAATGASAQSAAQAAPAMSPHIGHVLTSYKDTPGQKGFLETANAEADVAIQHATLGMKDLTNLDMMKRHAGHVLNALDPSLMAQGPGKGYGLKKASDNIATHITMAGQPADAPAAVKTHSVHVAQAAKNTSKRADEMIEVAQKIQKAQTAAEAKPLFEQLNAKAQELRAGVDANKDGKVDWKEGEGGLDMAKTHMDLMMKAMGTN
jgi:hypothetical protein